MSIQNLSLIFAPESVAVVGAGEGATSVGGMVVRNLQNAGFAGAILPVNPRRDSVHGLACFAGPDDLPQVPDLAVVATPASTVAAVVESFARLGTRGFVVLSAGFAEAGAEGIARQRELADVLARYRGTRMIGPNCLGVMVPRAKLNATFASATPEPGRLAFISQSGAVCTAVLDWAIERGVGFSHFISIGNSLDVDLGDLIDYVAADPATRAVLLYVESVSASRKFLSAARAFSRTRPIVACKSGRFAESAHAAASHTGALAGADDVYEAAFRRAGIERVTGLSDLFSIAELLAHQSSPHGGRLAIVTNAGGPGVLAADALLARGGRLARLQPTTLSRLEEILPPYWSHGNPIDVVGDAPADRLAGALEIVLEDDAVDAALVMLAPTAMADPTDAATAVVARARRSAKPILAVWLGGRAMSSGIERLTAGGIAVFPTPEEAIGAFHHLVSYARNLETLYETPQAISVEVPEPRFEVERAVTDTASGLLPEPESKTLLATYGIPVARSERAATADAAVEAARRAGYPVAVKILSPEISHKSDVGGVALDLRDDDAVRRAWDRVHAAARMAKPEAVLEGVSVQPMIDRSRGVELILGMKRDRTFGAAILLGLGGTATEVFRDRVLELPPLNERLARRMIDSLRCRKILDAWRGRPAVDLDALVESMLRFSALVVNTPEVSEIDVNPLLVTPDGVVALDARFVIEDAGTRDPAPFSHLAIRPYPAELSRTGVLADGTLIRFRPIRPEDEPLWHDLLGGCSEESLRARLGVTIGRTTHAMAVRYCFVDYDRELALVAELDDGGRRRFAAVGRLAADTDHETAEYAVLVADRFQGRGLGRLLTEVCLEAATAWGVRSVVARTQADNRRMRLIFDECGFASTIEEGTGLVRATRAVE